MGRCSPSPGWTGLTSHYINGLADLTDPRLSPALAASLAGLPPALVITAEYDPMRDQGVAYAAALSAAGVRTEHWQSPGMIHGFVQFGGVVDASRAVLDQAGQSVKENLA